ncbi:hypothetical protein [Bradyrhizobium cosmicum]|uniref:hypothetical protein n=1 Tax=Bradyrhizobium cosmicum TaxID=1404864 RepID=UPI001165BD9C|nr:hypothetical protein [Bradyrhizobium cosmicum]QDP24074.1 hypothetical protein FNV92_18760 [Bradyrhizobium cosmicum]
MPYRVDGYVRLGDREALQTLRAHRAAMLDSAKAIPGMDTSRTIATLAEDIEIIDAGLARLSPQREQQEFAPAGLNPIREAGVGYASQSRTAVAPPNHR